MKFGIGLPNYGPTATFDGIRRVALAAEALGYASVWTTDHIVVPRENRDPYGNIFESLVTLAMVSSMTRRVQLGTSVLVLPQRNPILAAKQVACIDAASNGRMILGVAVGWNQAEYKNLNAPFDKRGRVLNEAITLLRTLWTNTELSFQGQYTHIEGAMFSPQPAQKGAIPIWIGGNNEPAYRRTAKLGDGWHPTGVSPEELAQGLLRIRELGPSRPLTVSARLSVDLNPATPGTYQYRGARRYRVTGTVDAVRARLGEYAKAGLEHPMVLFPMENVDVMLAQMEQFASKVMPDLQ